MRLASLLVLLVHVLWSVPATAQTVWEPMKSGEAAKEAPVDEEPPVPEGCLSHWFCYRPPTGDEAHPAITGGMLPLWAGWIALPVLGPIFTPIIFIPKEVKPPFEGKLRLRVLAWALAPLGIIAGMLCFGIIGWIPWVGWLLWLLVILAGMAAYAALWWYFVPVNVLHNWNTAIKQHDKNWKPAPRPKAGKK